eukprot:scaffold6315_cov116-Cylindrotheca_fusiformis.AAC.11
MPFDNHALHITPASQYELKGAFDDCGLADAEHKNFTSDCMIYCIVALKRKRSSDVAPITFAPHASSLSLCTITLSIAPVLKECVCIYLEIW